MYLDVVLAELAHCGSTAFLDEARVVVERKEEGRELVLVRTEVGGGDEAQNDDNAAIRKLHQ